MPPSPPLAEKETSTLSPVFGLAFIVLLFVAGLYWASGNLPNPTEEVQKVQTGNPLYFSNVDNIRFTIPVGWERSTEVPTHPQGYANPRAGLHKPGTTCYIMQADQTQGPWPNKQLSFADRVFSPYWQFDGGWQVASSSDTANLSFSQEERQRIGGEFRESRGPRNSSFILLTNDGSVVPDECNHDLNELLQTAEPYYEITQLDPNSRGILSAEKVWDDVTAEENNKSYEHLIFTPDGSDEHREIMRIPDGAWATSFFIQEQDLYFAVNDYPTRVAALYKINPFTQDLKEIPGTDKQDSYISSLYLHNGQAYYLKNSSQLGYCIQGYHSCPADLYSVPLDGGSPVFIAHSSLSGQILGFEEGAVYIQQGWGDAGCSSSQIVKIIGGKEEKISEQGGCDGDPNYEEEIQTAREVIEKIIGTQKIKSKALRVESGRLLPASTTEGFASFYFDK